MCRWLIRVWRCRSSGVVQFHLQSKNIAMPDISALIEAYANGPKQLRDAVRLTPQYGWDVKPVEGKWSIRQVICHLADSEIVYADRMKRVIAEDNPTFFEADPDVFDPALHVKKRPWENELNLIEAARCHMLPILKACEVQDFQRTGLHSLDGPMNLGTLLERITKHIPHHIAFIKEKLEAMRE